LLLLLLLLLWITEIIVCYYYLLSMCVFSYQTECVPHQKSSVDPQRQIGKASSIVGLQSQPNDAAIYTGSHSLDTRLQMEKKSHPPDYMWPFVSVCK